MRGNRFDVLAKTIKAALENIDTWPGEFSIADVMKEATDPLGLGGGTSHLIAKKYRGLGYETCLLQGLYRRIHSQLRHATDEYGLRKYVCYRIPGKKLRHWLQFDNLTLKTLDYLTTDREALARDMTKLLPILRAAYRKLAQLGSDATFADVKAEVLKEIAS